MQVLTHLYCQVKQLMVQHQGLLQAQPLLRLEHQSTPLHPVVLSP